MFMSLETTDFWKVFLMRNAKSTDDTVFSYFHLSKLKRATEILTGAWELQRIVLSICQSK